MIAAETVDHDRGYGKIQPADGAKIAYGENVVCMIEKLPAFGDTGSDGSGKGGRVALSK